MYGLEKEKKGKDRFVFDLERDVLDNPERCKELLAKAELGVQNIKKALREGAKEEDFNNLGTLLQGFISLQKVLKKVKIKTT
jgi:hypothetical protein